MAVNAIDNTNLVSGLCNSCALGNFNPVVAYAYDAAAKTVTVQDSSTIPTGDTLSKVHLRVIDKFGKEVRATITATGAGGAQVIDVSSLDASKRLNLAATVLTTGHIAADGSAFDLQAAGNVGSWDTQANA